MDLYEKIINVSKNIALEEGLEAINIRLVAKNCNIAIGSIYNYFPSKTDLIITVVQCIWQDIFDFEYCYFKFDKFSDSINCIFNTISKNIIKYPNFFTLHSISFNEQSKYKGRKSMDIFLANIKSYLVKILENDKNVRKDVFDKHLTPNIFVDYIFNLLIFLLIEKKSNCYALIKLIEKSIY